MISNSTTPQATYEELTAALGQCTVMFDLFVEAEREIVERIEAAGDSPAKIVAAVTGLSAINAHLDLLLTTASKIRRRMVLAHGVILREQWQALHAELQGDGLNSQYQQDVHARIAQCRMAAAAYAESCDGGMVDPLAIDYAKAATKAAHDLFQQMKGSLAHHGRGNN